MFHPNASAAKPQHETLPLVLSNAGVMSPPLGVGGFRLSAFYSGERSELTRRQFTGKAVLELHDQKHGEAAVAIADVGAMGLAYVRSTGHDVSVSELHRPNLLVPVAGKLSIRNEHMRFESKNTPWVLIGRGKRDTSVSELRGAAYEAFVLSMPPQVLGDRLTRLEANGGMVWGGASSGQDWQLARLLIAFAAQISLSGTAVSAMEKGLAKAWINIILDQLKRCVDAISVPQVNEGRVHRSDVAMLHVREAERLMHERPDKIACLQDIARHVGVSERTLQVAFRKVRGATPLQVLAQVRLQVARRALLDRRGPRTVSDVLSICGIEHHGRFSRAYKEAFGESPVATLRARHNS